LLESTAFRVSEIDCVAMRYGFFYGPGTWYTNAGDMGEQVRQQQVPVIGAGQAVASFVHIEHAAFATVTSLERAPGVMRQSKHCRAEPRTGFPLP
jgi:nucleoside-diphosphate-sugar epimerase